MNQAPKRIDLEIIASLVAEGSRVLDIGSDNGDLLALLEEERNVRGCGIEISQEGVSRSVARGLNVIKGDAETELQNYPDGAFDYVILSQTIQAMHRPAEIIEQMLRIGKQAIVSLPNFGYLPIRFYLFFYGRMPVSSLLPNNWYNTPNIHLCTIKDFLSLTKEMDITLSHFLALSGMRQRKWLPYAFANLLAKQAIFVLKSNKKKES